jgi:hypothetical protein
VEKLPDAIGNIIPVPEGRQNRIGLSPLRDWEYISPSVPVVTFALHHRLIPAGVSDAKTAVETFAHNFEKENLQ